MSNRSEVIQEKFIGSVSGIQASDELDLEADLDGDPEEIVAIKIFEKGDSKNLGSFLYNLSREEVDDHPDLMIQIWADEISKRLKDDKTLSSDLQVLEQIFSRTFLDHYENHLRNSFDAEPLHYIQTEQRPILLFFYRLCMDCIARGQWQAAAVARMFFLAYEEKANRIENNNVEVDHQDAERIFRRIALLRLVKRTKAPTVVDQPADIQPGLGSATKRLLTPQEKDKPQEIARIGDLQIFGNDIISYKNKLIKLGKLNYTLLLYFVRRPDTFIPREELSDAIAETSKKHSTTNMNLVAVRCRNLLVSLSRLGINESLIQVKRNKGIILNSRYLMPDTYSHKAIEYSQTNTPEEATQEKNFEPIEAVSLGQLTVLSNRSASFKEKTVILTHREYQFINHFLTHPDVFLSGVELVELLDSWRTLEGKEKLNVTSNWRGYFKNLLIKVQNKLRSIGVSGFLFTFTAPKGIILHSDVLFDKPANSSHKNGSSR